MRKVFYVFFMLLVLSLVSSGGCGGSSSNSGGGSSGPSDWTTLSGTYKPVEGTITYYYVSGGAKETCRLVSSDNLILTVSGSGSVYDIKAGEGDINFEHSAGDSEHTATKKSYAEYSGTGFTASGSSLSLSQTTNNITTARKLSYKNSGKVSVEVTRKEGKTLMMKAEVTFELVSD